MKIEKTSRDYDIVAKTLHWSIAVLVLIMLAVGFFLDDMPETIKDTIINLHRLTGIVILALMLFRLIWRFYHTPPALPASVPVWQGFLAHLMHALLYLAVIIMPLAGWIMTSTKAGKAPHIGPWQLAIPYIPQSKALAGFCWQIHSTFAWVLIGLISLHILAGLKHALINRDGVFSRMWF